MYDRPIPDAPSALGNAASAVAFISALAVTIRRLIAERDDAADSELRLLDEAERSIEYWRQRALDAEALVDALRRAQSVHTCHRPEEAS